MNMETISPHIEGMAVVQPVEVDSDEGGDCKALPCIIQSVSHTDLSLTFSQGYIRFSCQVAEHSASSCIIMPWQHHRWAVTRDHVQPESVSLLLQMSLLESGLKHHTVTR